ncbi:NFACT RNA binding domain-containing protein [Fictibacillus enclensis]|uniref:Rqc2 family fibronectin-binding protein n=1 Tax=Fictibacillus enclensis TaxID=1017270 RepID=UPI0025A03E76|nr:NFACT RNA binding domain-containing protein [Fictibacillus enclensis]MDM5198810.1 NFACT RNA binding domain-containing protein [Fictibacillus enclensis]
MSFDGIATRAVSHEIKNKLQSGKITKIYQPDKTDLLFTVRAGGRNHKLLVSANPSFSRVQLTEQSYDNPAIPPMFCMLLRKHMEGSVIESIEQVDLERIIHIKVKNRDEIGDIAYKTLIIEIMGRHSNIILVDDKTGLISDCIKHIPPSLNRYRTLLPGQKYIAPPPQEKHSPLTETSEGFTRKIQWNEGKIDRQIVQLYSGLSPLLGKEIIHRAGLSTKEALSDAFIKMMEEVNHHNYSPQMVVSLGKEYFSVVALTHLDGEKKEFSSTGELLDRFYYGKAERDRVKQQAADLEKLLHNEYNKLGKKVKKLNASLADTEKADRFKVLGELLTAHLYMVKKGQKEIEVANYYEEDQPMITIPLDPQKGPSENAQQYFKKYNKLKSSVAYIEEQLEKTYDELAYFESLIQQMESASVRDVAGIREELEEQGYVRRRKVQKSKKNDKPVLETYQSSDGTTILVGKNNKQNDYLTFKASRQNETWLHTKDIPGSHVVIKAEDVSETTLLEAAGLAAYFSKAKHSGSVPVDYTLIRHVKKPSGAKPGFVIYDQQQTLYVTPDQDQLMKLKK